jgi:YHS domain-containing protein
MHPQILRWIALLLTAFFSLAHAAEPVSTGWLNNIAIGGKDTVSYSAQSTRTSHQVAQGNSMFAVQHKGATWQFASKASAEKFAANPDAYTPQYNGHCSNGLSLDEGLIPTSGEVWEIFADKLYLFYGERGRQRWLAGDWKAYRDHADKNWQAILAARR